MAANTTTVERTLIARLLNPTQHKQRKLEESVATYQQALHHGFAAADTQREANDIVIEYDLTGHAKNALKQRIPQLVDDADELQDDHTYPVRLTNEAARFDYDDSRAHPVCFRVPQAGRGTDFWIPLQLRESERDVWQKLVKDGDEDVEFGELKLVPDAGEWELHVTVKRTMKLETTEEWDADEVTPVGFDVGISQLLVGCAFEDGKPHNPFLYAGGTLRHAREKQNSATERLQERGSTRLYREIDAEYQRQINDKIEQATTGAVEYAARWENPVIVLEDVEGIREDIDSKRIHQWAFYQLQTRLEEKAAEAGIPVRYVHPDYTSQICHACRHVGYRPEQAEFRCSNEACWVTEYQADINAAANVARRLDPRGESLPWKSAGDDVPRNGAGLPRPEDTEESETHLSARRAVDDKASSSTTGGGAGTTPSTSSKHASSNLEGPSQG